MTDRLSDICIAARSLLGLSRPIARMREWSAEIRVTHAGELVYTDVPMPSEFALNKDVVLIRVAFRQKRGEVTAIAYAGGRGEVMYAVSTDATVEAVAPALAACLVTYVKELQ